MNSKYKAIRDIVETKTFSKIEGVELDLYTASMILSILDSLGEKNREKYLSMPITRMAELGWTIFKRAKADLHS